MTLFTPKFDTKKITNLFLGTCLLALPLMSFACDKTAISNYQQALQGMQAIDQSVHDFLKAEKSSQLHVQQLIHYYTAPQFIEEYHKHVNKLVTSLPEVANQLRKFYICSGLNATEIEARFGDLLTAQDARLKHLQMHDTEMHAPSFADKITKGHQQSVLIFGEQASSVLPPLLETQNIFDYINNNFAEKASIYDLWNLKEAKGTKAFMHLTGLNILKNSPQAKRQKHLDRGLSEESFTMFGTPKEGDEYPQTIHYLAGELADYDGSGTLPNVEQIPNRSKLAIVANTNDENLKQVNSLVVQYKTAVTQFKERAAKRFKITDWQNSVEKPKNLNEELQNWSIINYQQMTRFSSVLDKLTNPKAEIHWNTLNKAP